MRIVEFVILLALSATAMAQNQLTVLPWNGHKAALSITFDDALDVHLSVAAPEMSRRGLRGTFFLTISNIGADQTADWRLAAVNGQELGNHSITHQHPDALNSQQVDAEVSGADRYLRGLGVQPRVFAYPFGEVTEALKKRVAEDYIAARVSDGLSFNYYFTPGSTPDWYAITCQVARTATPLSEYKAWVTQDLKQGAWTNIQIHGIGKSQTDWEPMPTHVFTALLDYVKAKQDEGLWVASFGDVVAYWQAQKIFEVNALKDSIQWSIPKNFPLGVVLLVKAPENVKLYQNGNRLSPNHRGVYQISFDAGQLELIREH
jgi:peptidoglycan/xylan/chitin deacetylase (PgdA/CDA1 family)